MKLLVVTRKVDIHDDRMGFFIDWINEFAANVEKLTVISMQEGSKDGLAENIDVRFIGGWKVKKFFKYKSLLKEIVPHIDGIFVHMMPLYANLAGPLSVKYYKKLFLWYMHRSVDNALWETQKWVSGYITASAKSFRMETQLPVHIVGHAIPTEKFKTKDERREIEEGTLRLLTVGRISPSKHPETIVEAVNYLVHHYKLNVRCTIVGAPALKEGEELFDKLKSMVQEYGLEDNVLFVGPKQHREIPDALIHADIFINTSETGSLDKTVLEAMAAGTIPLTSNEAFRDLFTEDLAELMFPPGDYHALAQRVVSVHGANDAQLDNIRIQLRHMVAQGHDLKTTIRKIVNLYN